MEQPSQVRRAEKVSHLFIAIIQKLVTEHALVADDTEVITPAQLQALRFLVGSDSPLMGEVAHGLRISLPAATKAMDRLVRKELVVREEDASDRRVVRIRLTDKGLDLVRRVTELQMARLQGILDGMSPEDRAVFARGMECFVRSAVSDEAVVGDICLNCGDGHTDDCPLSEELLSLRTRGASGMVAAGA